MAQAIRWHYVNDLTMRLPQPLRRIAQLGSCLSPSLENRLSILNKRIQERDGASYPMALC
jgi:hypothetical protein